MNAQNYKTTNVWLFLLQSLLCILHRPIIKMFWVPSFIRHVVQCFKYVVKVVKLNNCVLPKGTNFNFL